ncbi:aminotransferase class V-fold PLP-dependent enzyme [Candidatus Micrarchaeota archaeon]|nr:aminotransferase class V-fold PLP-dependent enzyme [Candidatus Micrarchaeota archaeon]
MNFYKPPIDPRIVRPHYSKTLEGRKDILLTGHSHRVWPDVVEEGQMRPIELARAHVDRKWVKYIFGEVVPQFQHLVAKRAGISKPELIAFGENTHELVTRVLSCFSWNSDTKIVSTGSEFQSLTRQLLRLKEEGVDIELVSTEDKTTLTDRLVDAITPGTDVIVVSTIFFNDGYILQDLKQIIEKARRMGAVVIFDAYHQFNVRELDIDALGADIFVTAGGYKYAEYGEGGAWLKIPENCDMRPMISGWFADFESLEEKGYPYPVRYGPDYFRFLGATKDISGLCRAISALEFMDHEGLTVELLAANSLYQTAYMIGLFDELGLEKSGVRLLSSRVDSERGPIVAFEFSDKKKARGTCLALEMEGVLSDNRGPILRAAPAEYTLGEEIEEGMRRLARAIKEAV